MKWERGITSERKIKSERERREKRVSKRERKRGRECVQRGRIRLIKKTTRKILSESLSKDQTKM